MNKRWFVLGMSIVVLGALAFMPMARSAVEPGPFAVEPGPFRYIGGVVSNPSLPEVSGELILNVYVTVAPDGTGFGTISDPIHPAVNGHLAIHETRAAGNRVQFEGEIVRANDPAREGTLIQVLATLNGTSTSRLDVVLGENTFSGQGFAVRSNKLIDTSTGE